MKLAQLTRAALNGVHGGTKFLAALATGDAADDETILARRAICKECPSRVRGRVPPMTEDSDWCGPPLNPDGLPGVCGCLLAGKTAVGSEICPQGKWP